MVALRKKPHYVIVGEVRGKEVQQLFQIALTGHGCVSSIHAPGARDLLTRLGGDEMGVTDTQQASIGYMLNIQKIKDAERRHTQKGDGDNGGGPGPVVGSGALGAVRVRPGVRVVLSRYGGRHDQEQQKTGPGHPGSSVLRIPCGTFRRRMSLLQECVGRRAYGIDQVFAIISKYYNVTSP